MGELAIRAEKLGKSYRIGRIQERHNTLRDALSSGTRRILQAANPMTLASRGMRMQKDETIWALKDITFDVKQGDVLGIIGANGAGKSTLLKILTRITEPTTGYAEVHGRVGSLLEVGTGFHSELTGRENTYLNGAILGMTRHEIRRKFDEIVAFAEVDRFIDTPVKHYSSGMYLRLAFAVAAHLQADILIVDEVLAVGDAKFQKKCLGKIEDVARSGCPILFVSHNMNAVRRLCNRCIFLQSGRLVDEGSTASVINRYSEGSGSNSPPAQWINTSQLTRRGDERVRVQAVRYTSDRESLANQPYSGGPLEVVYALHADTHIDVTSLAVTIYDHSGTKLVNADTSYLGADLHLRQGRNLVHINIEALHLNPGVYWLGFWVASANGRVHDFTETALKIEVIDLWEEGFGRRPNSGGLVPCRFQVHHKIAPEHKSVPTAAGTPR